MIQKNKSELVNKDKKNLKKKKNNSVLEFFNSIIRGIVNNDKKGVSLIIPAYNEEKRIHRVIKTAKNIKEINEIVVVDDGSADKTARVARDLGAKVVIHHKNLGKGEAIRTGIANANEEILLFLDADLENIDEKKIMALIIPILKDKADFTKAAFGLSRGRVTEFAIKPMMKVLYPEEKFKQPISGQFAGRKQFFDNIEIEPRWGIDISILLDAIKKGERVIEVDIGEIKHKARTTEEKAEMSREVMETILKKIGFLCSKHKMIFFSDKTLFSPIFSKKVMRFLEILKNKKIKITIITSKKIEPEFKNFFFKVIEIKENESAKNIEVKIQKFIKKNQLTFEDCVSVFNDLKFEGLSKKMGVCYCFSNSPKSIQENSELISSLAEILMYLK